MYTVFNREPYTSWKIVLVDRYIDKSMEEIEVENPSGEDYEEFSCFYRTTYRGGRECEQFTMMSNKVDYTFLQLQIFKNGDIKHETYMPVLIDINKRKKRIEIKPLVYCEVNSKNRTIGFVPIED